MAFSQGGRAAPCNAPAQTDCCACDKRTRGAPGESAAAIARSTGSKDDTRTSAGWSRRTLDVARANSIRDGTSCLSSTLTATSRPRAHARTSASVGTPAPPPRSMAQSSEAGTSCTRRASRPPVTRSSLGSWKTTTWPLAHVRTSSSIARAPNDRALSKAASVFSGGHPSPRPPRCPTTSGDDAHRLKSPALRRSNARARVPRPRDRPPARWRPPPGALRPRSARKSRRRCVCEGSATRDCIPR
jgi:hypothetical protein